MAAGRLQTSQTQREGCVTSRKPFRHPACSRWACARWKREMRSARSEEGIDCNILCVSDTEGVRGTEMTEGACSHIDAIETVKHPKRQECEECVKIGARWMHLRVCQECGTTRCCDDSPNKHASKHARASKHPVIASGEPGERWLYCYPDDSFAEY